MIRVLAIALVCSSVAYCQTAAPATPSFEVASVKVNTTGGRPDGDTKGDRLTLTNMPMKVIIALSYRVTNDRVIGPAWLDTDGFDIVAKLAPDTTEANLWLMMQNLLIERFHLSVHRDQTPASVYALVAARKSTGLRQSPTDAKLDPTCDREGVCARDGRQFTCRSCQSTMADLVRNLPRWSSQDWFGMPIVDQTGLPGKYDFSLTWTPTNRAEDAVEPPGVSLFDALQDQLGLKLEQRKAPVDRIIVDHMERVPTAN
jgi:uncharacterized protein (TIGR03435 family)